MVPIALGTLGAACGSDTTNPLTAPAEVAEQGIDAAQQATALMCDQDRATLLQAIEAYSLLESAPPQEAQLVPDYLREESVLHDLDASGAVVPAPGSSCTT
jgi:hypothetical protein